MTLVLISIVIKVSGFFLLVLAKEFYRSTEYLDSEYGK